MENKYKIIILILAGLLLISTTVIVTLGVIGGFNFNNKTEENLNNNNNNNDDDNNLTSYLNGMDDDDYEDLIEDYLPEFGINADNSWKLFYGNGISGIGDTTTYIYSDNVFDIDELSDDYIRMSVINYMMSVDDDKYITLNEYKEGFRRLYDNKKYLEPKNISNDNKTIVVYDTVKELFEITYYDNDDFNKDGVESDLEYTYITHQVNGDTFVVEVAAVLKVEYNTSHKMYPGQIHYCDFLGHDCAQYELQKNGFDIDEDYNLVKNRYYFEFKYLNHQQVHLNKVSIN